MKRMYRSWLMLLLLAATAASAQNNAYGSNDTVLVDGDPPLTRSSINQLSAFFEWVFDGHFTPAERQEFERQRINEWRRNDRKSIESSQTLITQYERSLTMPDDQRQALHDRVQPAMLNLMRNQGDATGNLLIGMYNRAHQMDAVSSAPLPNLGTRSGRPEALIGEWAQGSASTIGFSNAAGVRAAPSGERLGFTLYPDGRFVEAYYKQSSLYSCTSQIFGYKTGNYYVQGTDLTFEEKTYTLTTKDSCNARLNSEKHPPIKNRKYHWAIDRDQSGLRIGLAGANNKYDYFYKEKGGQ